MRSEKYENLVFKEEITILKGSPIFENCVFEKGVYIKGDNKRFFLEGKAVRVTFKSCKFHSQGNEPSVSLWERAQGEFFDCKMSSEDFVPVRIDTGSHGVFRNCSIGYSDKRSAVAIMIESSGDFENCRFCCIQKNADAAKIEPAYFDTHNKEKTRFTNCSFTTAKDFISWGI